MTNWQWCLVAIASVIAGMVVSRLLKSGGAEPPKSKRKNDD